MAKYLALDPGITTGYAVFDENGDMQDMGDVRGQDELRELLNDTSPTLVICEDWRTKKDVRLGGDPLETVRIIGRVEEWCKSNNCKFILQPNTVKSIAYRWAGMKPPRNHALTHRTDAYVHGVYYLQKAGIRRPQQAARS